MRRLTSQQIFQIKILRRICGNNQSKPGETPEQVYLLSQAPHYPDWLLPP